MATKTETKQATKVYGVSAQVTAEINIEINATTWQDAVSKATQLTFSDFADPQGDVNYESSPRIQSIYLT